MSHLTILPTVLHDIELLADSLHELGFAPQHGGELRDFGGAPLPLALRVEIAPDTAIGWQRQPDGSLALVGDLQRLSRSRTIPQLLGAITRAYAARRALQEAAVHLPQAFVTLQP